jgi:hypothetical protein
MDPRPLPTSSCGRGRGTDFRHHSLHGRCRARRRACWMRRASDAHTPCATPCRPVLPWCGALDRRYRAPLRGAGFALGARHELAPHDTSSFASALHVCGGSAAGTDPRRLPCARAVRWRRRRPGPVWRVWTGAAGLDGRLVLRHVQQRRERRSYPLDRGSRARPKRQERALRWPQVGRAGTRSPAGRSPLRTVGDRVLSIPAASVGRRTRRPRSSTLPARRDDVLRQRSRTSAPRRGRRDADRRAAQRGRGLSGCRACGGQPPVRCQAGTPALALGHPRASEGVLERSRLGRCASARDRHAHACFRPCVASILGPIRRHERVSSGARVKRDAPMTPACAGRRHPAIPIVRHVDPG